MELTGALAHLRSEIPTVHESNANMWRSETELQSQLHPSRISRRCDLTVICRRDVRREALQVRMIRGIEGLHPELQLPPRGEDEVLKHRKGEGKETGPLHPHRGGVAGADLPRRHVRKCSRV